ncbi:MAG: hypothetical protein WDA65_08470 [Christensenellales bacterium]
MRPTEKDKPKDELKEALDLIGAALDKDCSLLLGRAIEKTEERQNGRIEKLSEQVSRTRVALAETEGQIDEIKATTRGEVKLVYEMINRLNEKIERIEANTSKEQNSKTMWRIALIAALPGVISVIIKLAEVISGG